MKTLFQEIRDVDLNELCANILESARVSFIHPELEEMERSSRTVIPSSALLNKNYGQQQMNPPNYELRRAYESDDNESDTSMASNLSQCGPGTKLL
jgi:hypothetical protein